MSTDFDVLVVGAGILGAGTAEALAESHHSVVILEQQGIAAATSSRSSKLIHGGLRYLESGQFRLVYECLRERSWLLQNKPDLVRMVPFYIPIYQHSKRPAWVVRLGLSLYSLLSGLSNADSRFRSVPKPQWNCLPGLKQEALKAVFRYYDAQTDDAALTRDVVASAIAHGAQIICPGSLVGAEVTDDDVRVDYVANGKLNTLHTRALVNCSGPWVANTNARCTPPVAIPPIDLVAGTHILLPLSLGDKIYYVEANDGRAIFVMPWQDKTLVGTTERPYFGDPRDVTPTMEEESYLLHTVQQYFSQTRSLRELDICESYSGLRVLPEMEKSPFARSRESIICCDDDKKPRLLAVAGGKLTSYRATARKLTKKLEPTLRARPPTTSNSNPSKTTTSSSERERNL
ncbi:glycerol-3-phosphate dehydrogenase/oxidase [Microbulbifer sp. OS29]|uniref:Glycerol-3-phosphate dehydrogenase/oxidase n=1 Tax=Microbulbifer okhotskensis TaxID=2926617 RepID=A0A9X2J5Y4_9GAMM|nr:glycerol-3-phosphate dehydrogenase/oxidase [Microbulbifer okhotskensis]MCO1335698.1 glycerol-3-phosphate dehydrogenase/oxidase [Microbulbifer okhotskensis]